MTEAPLIRGEVLRSLRRHWAMPLFLALLVGFVVLARGPVHEARATATDLDTGDGRLRTISVWATTPEGRTPLTRERIDEIAAIPGVTKVTPYDGGGAEVYLADDQQRDDPRMLTLLPWTAAHPPLVTQQDTEAPSSLKPDQIVLPDGFAGLSAARLLGRDIVVLHTPVDRIETDKDGNEDLHGGEPVELRFTVTAVHDDSMGNLDGPGTSYVHPDVAATLHAESQAMTVKELFATEGFENAHVEVASASKVREVQQQLRQAGFYAASVAAQMQALSPTLSLLETAGTTALWAVTVLAALFGLAMGTQRVRSRMNEIGLLKALGFSETRIFCLLALELFIIGTIAALTGIVLGLAAVTVSTGPAAIHLPTAAMLLPLPGVALVVGALLPLYYARRLPPDRVLRDA
ncbi:ABC transporter permease [Streptomyces sp. 549]|uniref:ABC transporter permease n=1 Tax=Streptomyces sp. 549 TaxID=3049076 RepID=UPI0024C41F73|nr:ABC transporter permease [Streptomyces sp. 549]MDK1475991.1 ABC transporter permease [Streptomyces sp. 549]